MAADPRAMAAGTSGAPLGLQPGVLRMLGWCVAVLLIASALLPLVPRLFAPRAVTTLGIAGDLNYVSADRVRRAVAPHLQGDFYELDLVAVKAAVEALPWVANARVERTWPATISVYIREHRAIARWGEQELLSDDGRVFAPGALTEDLAALPRLAGPAGQQVVVHQAFAALTDALRDTPFAPARLTLNARGEWIAVTGDGIELRLGRGAPLDAVASLAGPVRTALEGRLQEVTYVDLHYFNGFAVGWRERLDDPRSAGLGAEGRRE